uniref:Thioredoxin domain containing 16 n=1 Tax=Amphiprion percula TaxID=161767 RepID=A0A3P8TK29_AMPPE
QQTLFSMMWMCVAVFLLWMRSGGCTEKANMSDLIEYTAADFYEKLHSGKMMFIYFEHQAVHFGSQKILRKSFNTWLFLVFLWALLTLTKISNKTSLKTGSVSFHFSAILRDEVKYVHTDADLLAMEKAARWKKDIVLGYVQSLGTQEHRSIMETAYVYGSKYQFILITGGPVLKHLGVNESSHSSKVWFLHCRVHSGLMTPVTSERCPLTCMRKPLSTLSLHSFLQLMEAPLSEVYDDPSSVQPPQFPYQQTPQVFLFSRPATEHLDLDTATALAWRLRGLALLLLVHRCVRATGTCMNMDLNSLETRQQYFPNTTVQEKNHIIAKEEVECWSIPVCIHVFVFPGNLDDEVAASVFEKRGDLLDMDSVTQLTSENFHTAVAQSSLTVALFYLKWDAVSMAFLSSFIEVSERLVVDVRMSAVDCGEWTDLCATQPGSNVPFQPITAFPSILVLRPQETAQHYRGMLGSEALHRFIPELTVENLPSFLSLGKALLILFVGEEEDEIGQRQNQALVEEMRGVLELGGRRMEEYLPCWIHLGRTPAGMSVLGSYLGSMPPLPALVLSHLPSGDEIYRYPPNTPIAASSVLLWLQRIEDGTESPAGTLGDDNWPPAVEFYDFLKIMDMQEADSTQQQTPKEEEEVDEEEVSVEEHLVSEEVTHDNPDNNPSIHSEL